MSSLVVGIVDWGSRRSTDGHRDYGITWLVRAVNYDIDPSEIYNAIGLPQIGDQWAFGLGSDPWALCHPDWDISTVVRGEPNLYFLVAQTFSTRPLRRCQDTTIEDPLLEPPDIGGSFVKYVKEIKRDRFDQIPMMSSHELVKGSLMEFDHGKPTVSITVNHATLDLPLFTSLQDHVNDAMLWGLDPRMIKLSNTTWQRRIYGVCNYYFRKTYEFDVDFKTFDREFVDIGSRVLAGWCPGTNVSPPIDPDAADPTTGGLPKWLNIANFEHYRDVNGDIIEEIPLDGKGRPAFNLDDQAVGTISFYEEGNLLALGIPSSLEF
jgi:hypothetical protein